MRVVHKKRGTVYETVGYANVQCDRPIADYDVVMIYQDAFSGKYWVRPAAEFDDGRFAEVPPVSSAKPDAPETKAAYDFIVGKSEEMVKFAGEPTAHSSTHGNGPAVKADAGQGLVASDQYADANTPAISSTERPPPEIIGDRQS